MKDVTIRMYEIGDEEGIIRLFRDTFGREMSYDEWQWKYRGQGNKKVCSAVIADSDRNVVGHYGGISLRMVHHGKAMTGTSVCDAMIMPKYRGIWRLKRLHDFFIDFHVKNGATMIYGFPTEKTLLLPSEKMRLYERIEAVLDVSKELTDLNDPTRFLFRFAPLSFDDPRIDDLWSLVEENFSLSIIRDRTYFDWRYKRNPLFSYEIWGLTRKWSDKLLGLIIFKKDDSDKFLIMDAVFRNRILAPLLKRTGELALRLGKKRMSLLFPQRFHPELVRLGFTLSPSGITLPRSTHEGTLGKDEIRAHFFYTWGDTDFL